MATAYESADLIMKLYDLRREEKMRQARLWYRVHFHPSGAQDVVDVLQGEHSAYYRMVSTYWEDAREQLEERLEGFKKARERWGREGAPTA